MGGFMIKDGKKNYDVLTYERFKVLLEGQIAQDDNENSERKNSWPRQTINQENPKGSSKKFELKVSKQEIEHRSKGNLMAMVIASGQTWWFVIQCLVRFIARLNITLIELTAFAFAIINIISWSLWMHKPHHVRLPIYLDLSGDRIPGPDFEKIRKKRSESEGQENNPLSSTSTIEVGELEGDSTSKTASKTQGQTTWRRWIPTSLIRPLLDAMGVNPRGLEEKVIENPRKNISKDHTSANADKDTPKDYTVENVGTYYTAWFKVPDEQAKKPTAFPKRKVALIGSAIAALLKRTLIAEDLLCYNGFSFSRDFPCYVLVPIVQAL
ncbi:hypothetical protein AX16_001693 [Volvariella volvacea WC 439]|nr:hypothetical protein AX16_001693 [Volvariella volvacea WC 439]